MKAEILITGNEILSGKTADVNSSFIARTLANIGIQVIQNQTVGDDLDKMTALLKELSNRAPLVIVTGGLGPTPDDLTAEAAANASNTKLMPFNDALESIRSYFSQHQKSMPKSNEKQALLPENSIWFKNEVGTAPGFALTLNCCFFVFLPGVPREMQQMLDNTILPLLKEKFKDALIPIHEKILSAYGMPEAEIGEKLHDIPKLFPDVILNTCPELTRIQIMLSTRGHDQKTLLLATAEIKNRLGDIIFSEKNEQLEDVVVELLLKKKATLSIAESCTGGLIASKITDIPGSSACFNGGIIAYSNNVKNTILKVSNETLEKHGAVSNAAVKEMAANIQALTNSNYALAISGIAGPAGGTKEKPIGTVKIGLATPENIRSFDYYATGADRISRKQLFTAKALDVLRRELLS
jgi:nicotinamide-nucleotide amidase